MKHGIANRALIGLAQLAQRWRRQSFTSVALAALIGSSPLASAGVIPIAVDDQMILIPCGEVSGNTGTPSATVTTSSGHSTVSDSAGNYQFTCLPVGDVELVVSKPGAVFLPERKSVLFKSDNVQTVQVVNFALATQTDPALSAFWNLPFPAGAPGDHDGLFAHMIRQACVNGAYPEYTCTAQLPAAADKAWRDLQSGVGAKNHNLNGCSALDGIIPGPYVREGGGVFGGIDNLWFKRSCMNHDNCFHHGFDPAWRATANSGTWGGMGSVNECNTWFRNDNQATCDNIEVEMLADGTEVIAGNPPSTRVLNTKLMCKWFADLFYLGVVIGDKNYHASARLNNYGDVMEGCSPKITGVYTTGVIGKTMRIDTPLADPDPYCHPAPTALTLSSKTSSSIAFSWSAAQDATGYVVYRNGAAITSTITGTSYNNTGLSPSTTYSYYVKAVFADLKQSAASASLSATTDVVNAPTLSQYSLSANSVSLSWTFVSGAQSYNLYRDGTRILSNTTFTTHTDGGRTAGATHAYVVRAVANGVEGGPSNTLSVTFPFSCGSALTATGSSSGLTREMDLGTRSGVVQIRFNAYTIPDEPGVRYKGASNWLFAPGVISGQQTASFNYTYGSNPRLIEAKVWGNVDPGTWWEMAISCPGDPLPTITYPTREVSFWVGDQTCNVPWKMQIDGGAWIDIGIFTKKLQLAIRKGHSMVAGWQGTCNGSTSNPGNIYYRDGSGTYRLYPGYYGGSAPTLIFEVK